MLELPRNWWAPLLQGVFAVLFGVLAIAWPGPTLLALVYLFGFFALASGLTALAGGVRAGRRKESWTEYVLVGVTGVLAGLVALFAPGITAVALLVLIAAWAIIGGIFELLAAVKLRKVIEREWLLFASGVLSILFGAVLMFEPAAGALAVAWLIGLYAILHGVLLAAFSFWLRGRMRRAEAPAHA